MSKTKDEMRRNIEYISSQLTEFEGELRRKEHSMMSKIEAERSVMEKFASRRDFYEKMQSNMGPGEEHARSNLSAAEKEMAIVQQRIVDMESSKADLEESLSSVRAQNELNVLPELERLGKLLEGAKEEIATSSRACAADEQRMQELKLLKESMDGEDQHLRQTIKEREDALLTLQAAPDVHAETMTRVQQDATQIQHEIDDTNNAKENVQEEIDLQQRRKSETGEQKISEITTTHREQRALEERRLRIDGYAKEVEGDKIRNYSLAAQRLEIELQTKKNQDEIRHGSKFLVVENRQLKIAMSSLLKKQQSTANLKSSIPQMRSKLQILEQSLSVIEAEKLSCDKALLDIKGRVDSSYQKLYDGQYIEEDALLRLEESAKSVAEREYEIEQSQNEERRAMTICSLMKERRRITLRKLQQAEQSSTDADLAIQYQEIQKLDLTKKKKDAEKRAGDFGTLHDMIRSEKVECTLLVGDAKRALNSIVSRCADFQVELISRTAERENKIETLQDKIDTRRAAQHARALKCTDKSKSWASYRQALEDVERQEAYIEKLKASLGNSQKEVARATLQTEQLMGMKQSMAKQLHLRKTQLRKTHHLSNKYAEAHKREEIGINRTEEERQVIELKKKDVQRRTDILKRDLENPVGIEEKIESCKRKLELQIVEMEKLSHECETPGRRQFHVLEGEDPSKEELEARLFLLEHLAKKKKELLLTKEIAVKDVSFRIQQCLAGVSVAGNNTKCTLMKERNVIQGHIHERKRLRIAQRSEICMYDELIATGFKKMVDIEQDICLREQLIATDRTRSNRSTLDTSVESSPVSPHFERPNAYLPVDDDTHAIVRVPRPYGALAPFAPGTTMSRYRGVRMKL